MKWINKGHQFDKVGALFSTNMKVYVYGAGQNGSDLFSRMEFLDCIEAFIDNDQNKCGKKFHEKEIVSLEKFLLVEKDPHIVVIAQSLENIVMSKQQLLLAGYEEGRNLFDYHTFRNFYLPIFAVYSWDKIYVPTVSMLMTTICNLDCKGCLNFTHDNKTKKNYSIERLKSDVDCIFSKVDMVGLFHLCGGEPLLYPHFEELITYINDNYRHKISILGTATNGTVLPSNELCEQMKVSKMMVCVDDYRENVTIANENYEPLLSKLDKFNVDYYENKVDKWMDIYKTSIDTSEDTINKCTICALPFVSLKNHKIYGCNYSDYACEAKIVQEDLKDSLDLLQLDKDYKKILLEYILGYSEEGYYSFCSRCNGYLTINTNKIPVAEQYIIKKDYY